MSSYTDTPLAREKMSTSQKRLRSNFKSSDTSFGIDHYPFSDQTTNNGYHKVTHWPNQGTQPASSASYAQIFGFTPNGSIGVLNFSQAGIINYVSTPLTFSQSDAAPIAFAGGASLNIVDVAGITTIAFEVHGYNGGGSGDGMAAVGFMSLWHNGGFHTKGMYGGGQLSNVHSGTIFQLKNTGSTLNNFFWTVRFLRVTV